MERVSRSVGERLSAFMVRVRDALAAWRHRRLESRARAICPVDSLVFSPHYSNGSCPLCGWTPDGYVYSPPPLAPYDRYWGAMAGIAAVSVVMCVLVVIASTHS